MGAALDSPRSGNPTVNFSCEGSRLHTPYESLMPDDPRWSRGGGASAGERLQVQIITSREVWLRRDHTNQLLADSYQNPSSEWQVTIKLHLVAGYKATPSFHGKTVFHEASPWCQRGWGLADTVYFFLFVIYGEGRAWAHSEKNPGELQGGDYMTI